MTSVRLVLLLVAGLLLAAPSATAGSASGDLTAGSLLLGPDATLEAPSLAIGSRAAAPPTLELDARDVTVHRIGEVRAQVGGTSPVTYTFRAIDERASYPSARLTLEMGAGEQLLALQGAGAASALVPGATVRGVGGALLGSAVAPVPQCASANADEGMTYCLDVFGVYELASADAQAALSGEISLLLYGPTLVVERDGGTVRHASGLTAAQEAGPATQSEDAWVVVRIASATGTIRGEALRLFSAAPALHTSSLQLEDASGELRVGAKQYRASGDDVEALGQLRVIPGPVPAAPDHGIDGETVYAESVRTRVEGDVASINLRGASAFLDTPAERAGAAAILAVGLAAIAYAWNHLLFGAAALYTRLSKPEILDNTVRNRIYDIIRENPGISAREVHRRSEQSWGTVVYHLRQLERHHLVVSRALGRTRNYYENHGKYRGMEVQLACLQSDRALVLARAIVAQPGITQEQLAMQSGFPQPTTSYYVRKLKQAGLVEEQREGRYVKYVPHADLPRYVAMADHQPTVGGAAVTGVQA